MKWYIQVWKKYAVFSGRAHRTEYWMFFLFNFIVAIGVGLISGVLGAITSTDQSILGNIYTLATLVPSLAVGVRRMHDTDRSGWWIIVPIANLIFAITKGTEGENRFGSAPSL
ncbi:putative membrane protein [Xenococcus sp. PCC 7305]|uniref:DUF805 domain-containing protein n=1 Tax=Xenococcus sp. PCC 7305 TaxID=102125 RepID=UPI0002ABA90B|nr:DUF805 domain-containing protein [Xenococcus sp. PCC 7305]ELS02198.1 putative membrane protein [Xenococcus sp. PCC 7305]